MEIKEDCFAYNSYKKECNALKELYCANENCKFYKNKQKFIIQNFENSRNKV